MAPANGRLGTGVAPEFLGDLDVCGSLPEWGLKIGENLTQYHVALRFWGL